MDVHIMYMCTRHYVCAHVCLYTYVHFLIQLHCCLVALLQMYILCTCVHVIMCMCTYYGCTHHVYVYTLCKCVHIMYMCTYYIYLYMSLCMCVYFYGCTHYVYVYMSCICVHIMYMCTYYVYVYTSLFICAYFFVYIRPLSDIIAQLLCCSPADVHDMYVRTCQFVCTNVCLYVFEHFLM